MTRARELERDFDHVAGNGLAAGLRIALFSGNYNCVRDGANKALNKLVAFLLDQGAAVRVYSPTVANPAFEPAGDLVSVPSFPIPGRPEYRIAPKLTRGIRADLDRFAPTHIHVSAPDWLGTGAQAYAWANGLPVVASLHTRFETYLEYYRLGALTKWVGRRLDKFYRDSDYILCPNAALADAFRADGFTGNVGIWSRGVDRALFNPERRDPAWRRVLGYADSDVVPLFFGRLVQEKGLDVFVDAIKALDERGMKVPPLVVGYGPEMDWMRERLPEARFTGHLDGPDLARAVASADVLINPSVTEAFGNVNLEAMASGLAIVSADVDSASALITDDIHGLLVTPRDPDAYADAVLRLAADRTLRRRLARQAAAESGNYLWSKALGNVVHAYRLTGTPAVVRDIRRGRILKLAGA